MANLQLNVSNATTTVLYPADLYTFFVDVTIPANSSVFTQIYLKLPVDSYSASMTVVNMTVVSILKYSLILICYSYFTYCDCVISVIYLRLFFSLPRLDRTQHCL
jgi:hypothetical protein